MTQQKLTSAQQKVYDAILWYVNEHRIPPTLSELAEKLSIGVNAVRDHLLVLNRKQILRYVPNISRGIELLTERPEGVPIYGSAPAGHPFMSQENMVDTFEVKKYVSGSEDLFGIYVRGDSMKDAQLGTGDLLFVDPKREPRNGEIVVAAVEGDPTIKRYYRDGNSVTLQPENKKYKPIVVGRHDENFRVLGVVIGMIRALDKKRIDELTGFRRAS
ncbi:MAG: transcriptional repressor LexA [Bacteroidota bacterium]|jgi:repressor LexA